MRRNAIHKKFDQSGIIHHIAIIIAFIVLFGAIGTYIVISGHAAPSPSNSVANSTAQPATAGYPLCASSGKGNCLSDSGHTGLYDNIYMKKRAPGPNQNIAVVLASSECNNGHVRPKSKSASGCPFASSTGDNTDLSGNPIYRLKFTDTGVCVGYYNGVVVTGCSSGDGLWVQGPQSGEFVNVSTSNESPKGEGEFLDSADKNHLAQIGEWAIGFGAPSSKEPSIWAHD